MITLKALDRLCSDLVVVTARQVDQLSWLRAKAKVTASENVFGKPGCRYRGYLSLGVAHSYCVYKAMWQSEEKKTVRKTVIHFCTGNKCFVAIPLWFLPLGFSEYFDNESFFYLITIFSLTRLLDCVTICWLLDYVCMSCSHPHLFSWVWWGLLHYEWTI